MSGSLPVRRALLAVADKSGLPALAGRLADLGVELVSTGNTAKAIADAGVPVTPVADVTGFPEMLDGRVKTLHPRIHAGLLADRRKPDHVAQLEQHGIRPFDLVVVNLYPFREAVAAGASFDDTIEQIDIGGPAMVRAAAKNFESVAVVVSPEAYDGVLEELSRQGGLSRETRFRLAREAFAHTAAYDAAISGWLDGQATGGAEADGEAWPPQRLGVAMSLRESLRYGENPHQRAALYGAAGPPALGDARVLQGKETSFNNWLDAEAARAVAGIFDLEADGPCAVIVKHHNPCGVAVGATFAEAYTKALDGDRVSAFGGIVAFNGEVDAAAAGSMADVFTEVVIAPGYTDDALEAFGGRQNLRVVRAVLPGPPALDVRLIDGGALLQDPDVISEARDDMRVVTATRPTEEQWRDLLFAWKVAARVKSNAIVLVRDRATVGVGAGQMNRLWSVDIASRQAGEKAAGAVLASDAFFPFRDGLDRAAEAGVVAVIQPGGSVRDDEVVAAAEEHGMAMVHTGRRHFRH